MPTRMRWISKTPARLLFANTYMYRVSRNVLPKTYAIVTRRSNDIAFENVKVFSQTRLAFDNAVYNEANGAFVRSHYFTRFAVNAGAKPRAESSPPASLFARRDIAAADKWLQQCVGPDRRRRRHRILHRCGQRKNLPLGWRQSNC